MAIVDNLKLFKNENGYDVVIGKPEIDENFETLANTLDDRIEKDDENIILKGEKVTAGYDVENNGSRSVVCCDKNKNEANGSAVFGAENEIQADGKQSLTAGTSNIVNGLNALTTGYKNTNNSENGVVFGNDNNISGARNFCMGQYNVSEAPDVYNFGGLITGANTGGFRLNFGMYFDNSQDFSKSFGAYYYKNIETAFFFKTDDDTKTDYNIPIVLYVKSLAYITIKGQALQDDYSTKWIFERKLIVLVDKDGKVTIDSDDNTDIKKDDEDWKFDIESNDSDDDNPPILKISVTGKADTNIIWGGLVDIHFVENK